MTTTAAPVSVPQEVHAQNAVVLAAARALVRDAAPVITTIEAGRGHLLTAGDTDMLRVLDGVKSLSKSLGVLDAIEGGGA